MPWTQGSSYSCNINSYTEFFVTRRYTENEKKRFKISLLQKYWYSQNSGGITAMVIWTNLDHNMDQNRRCLYFYLGRSKMAKKVGFHLWTFPCTNQKASTCCSSTQRWDLPFFRPVDLQWSDYFVSTVCSIRKAGKFASVHCSLH